MNYGNEKCMPATLAVCRNLTVSESLYQQKKDLTERLELIEKAIEAVNSVPNLQQALDAISKVGF